MDLKNRFDAFAKEQHLSQKTTAAREFLTRHNQAIKAGVQIARSFVSFATSKSPFAFVEGVFSTFEVLTTRGNQYAAYYFTVKNGWTRLIDAQTSMMLEPGLANVPYHPMGFEYDGAVTKVYAIPGGELAYIAGNAYDAARNGFYIRGVEEKVATDFIVEQNIKHLNSRVLSLAAQGHDSNGYVPSLLAEPIDPKPSKLLTEMVAYISKAFELGINRSFILHGPPGSGKSSLSQGIINELGLKTLIYKDEHYDNLNTFFFVVKHFGIEAILLDDFDQVKESNKLLKMLERINKEVKLVIGLVNSMEEFHPAVVRPRRFDEIKLVEVMDEDVVKGVLGSLSEEYFDKVKAWPIAYTNELVSRSKLYPIEELNKHYEELDKRVEKQLAALNVPIETEDEGDEDADAEDDWD